MAMTIQGDADREANGAGGELSFAGILSPIPPETFFAEYHGRKVLHVPGSADKFASVMSWVKLNALLNMTALWTSRSFEMALDGVILPAREYCRPAVDHGSGAPSQQPDAARVTALLKQGASLLLNDIDTFNPGLAAVARALEDTLESRVQANLYCSASERQAFPSHFDTHDVYAVHVEGEKLWRIYEGRLDNPVAHPAFQGQPPSFHERSKGKISAEILLKPGDLLYIPRGTYHDALAQTDGTLHVAFGAVSVIGLDFVSGIFERAVHDPLFRQDLPRRHAPGGDAAFDRHMRALSERLEAMVADQATLGSFRAFQDSYRYPRGGFALSESLFGDKPYRVTSREFSVVRRGSAWVLRKGDKTTAIPAGFDRAVTWIINRDTFAVEALSQAAPELDSNQRQDLLHSLEAMGVITRDRAR
jgi:ribosomal protein L16 Arg81 hydroxylase